MCVSKKITGLLFYTAIIGSFSNLSVAQLITPEKALKINEGQTLIINGEFEAAYNFFESYREEFPSDPAGLLFQAAVIQSEMMDGEENLFGEKLKELCDSVKTMAENIIADCSRIDSAVCYLYMGHQYAYRSIWNARFGSNFSALSMGIKAKNRYKKGLAIDSTLYDLCLGLGSYHYWKTVKSGILRYIGLFKNEKEKGIAEIQLAADSSFFSKETSISALIWIMINEKNYDSAIVLSMKMFQKYPDGNSFLWPLAESYYKSEQFEKSAETYGILINRLSTNPGNYFNLIEAVYYTAKSFDKAGTDDNVGEMIEFLKSKESEIPKKIKRRQRSKLVWLFRR